MLCIHSIEDRIRQSSDPIEIVQLGKRWFELKLNNVLQRAVPDDLDLDERNKRLAENLKRRSQEAPRLGAELRRIADGKGSVVERAIRYFEKKVGDCGAFCYERGTPEDKFFSEPDTICPPESTLKEMSREECPFRGS